MWKKRNGKCVYFFFLNTYSLQDLNRNSFLSLALASFSLLWLYTRRIISSTFHMEDERGQQLKDNPKWSISSNSLIMSSFTLEWTRTFKAHQLFVKFISFFRLLSLVTYTYVNADVRHATQLRGIFVMVSVTSANIVDTKFYQIKSEKIKYNFFGCGFFIETQIKRVTQLIVGTLLQVSDEVQRWAPIWKWWLSQSRRW